MFSRRIDRLTGSLIREILQLTQRPEVISFAAGLPAPDVMPHVDFSDIPEHMRQYGPTEGEMELRAAVARQLGALGRECTPQQVLITSGSQQGVDLVAKLFIDEGTAVALESPTYLAAIQAFRLFGAEFVDLPLSSDGMDAAALAAAIAQRRPAFVYLIPNFQNPSGYSYSAQRREEIAGVLEASGVPLVEDEPYRELMYDPVDRTPICSLLKNAPWIYLGSFSKTLCPGMRIGYLACSPELFPLFVRLKQATDLHSNRYAQRWIAGFVSGPAYAPHLQHLRDYYRVRRDAMDAALQRHFRDLAEWQIPHGGLFFWVRLKHACDTRLLLPQALQRNVAFMPGEPFHANGVEASGALRLNFSHATPERIETGIAILADVVRAQRAGGFPEPSPAATAS